MKPSEAIAQMPGLGLCLCNFDLVKKSVAQAKVPSDMVDNVCNNSGLDILPITEGLSEEDAKMFKRCLATMLIGIDSIGVAACFVMLMKQFLLPMAQRERALEKMYELTGPRFTDDELKEIFLLMKLDLDSRMKRDPKPWELYDKVASYLGENDSRTHIEAVRAQWAEEETDKWRNK